LSLIKDTFKLLKSKNEGALIGYITAGDPKPEYTHQIAEALIRGGVDLLELGLPFSDPIADGPTIQAASVRALEMGTTPKLVLEMADKIKQKHQIPIVVMTYFNPVFRIGLSTFFDQAKRNQVDGLIIPDLPIEEADEYRSIAHSSGLDTIFLATPSTSELRLRKIAEYSSGFLYLVSQFGVTGERRVVEESTINLVKQVSNVISEKVPLAVGFGISKPEHVKKIIEAGADGAIVGSAFVNVVHRNRGNFDKMLMELETKALELKKGTLN
jgi:tryptophan synthase alpha chain